MSELSKRLAEAKGDRSIDDIATQAQRRGHKLDRSAVARYVNGKHGPNVRPSTIEALAAGFDLDARELRELAGLPPGELGPWEPTKLSASLTQKQRDALDDLIRAFVKGASDDLADHPEKKSSPTPLRPAGRDEQGQPVRQAASRRRKRPDETLSADD